jgi:hypothetical protein
LYATLQVLPYDLGFRIVPRGELKTFDFRYGIP